MPYVPKQSKPEKKDIRREEPLKHSDENSETFFVTEA